VFDDAYKSKLSGIVMDDIERVVEWGPLTRAFQQLHTLGFCVWVFGSGLSYAQLNQVVVSTPPVHITNWFAKLHVP
jgi:hypothetical protein